MLKKVSNKIIFAIFAMLFLLSCASVASSQSKQDSLDVAIRKVSDYMNSTIKPKSKIVIVSIESTSPGLSTYIIDGLINNIVNDRQFTVVDRQQLDVLRTELKFQWSGEVDEATAMEIGKFFAAQATVSGRVSQIGKEYQLVIRANDAQTAEILGQTTVDVKSSKRLKALLTGK